MYQIKKKLILSLAALFLATGVGLYFTPQVALAAKEKTDPGNQRIFDGDICPALESKVQNTTLDKYCANYMYQEDLDDAYHKICDVHGAGGTRKLQTECNKYKNYEKGSFTPASGDSATTLKDKADPAIKGCKSNNCDFIDKYVNPAITLLTFSFGLIAVISLIIGGIQYSASGGDPQNVAKAKKRITDTLIAVVAYFFLFSFLQFLIPGGLFNR